MSRMTIAIILFWVALGVGLIYQVMTAYVQTAKEEDKSTVVNAIQQGKVILEKRQKMEAKAVKDGANVIQTNYTFERVNQYMFHGKITLTNIGNVSARNVAIFVRPFWGGEMKDSLADEIPIDNDAPGAKYGLWVHCPDLGPKETISAGVDFNDRPEVTPGDNPGPEIKFDSDEDELKKLEQAKQSAAAPYVPPGQ